MDKTTLNVDVATRMEKSLQ